MAPAAIVAVLVLPGVMAIIMRARRSRSGLVYAVTLAGALRCVTCKTGWPRVMDAKGKAIYAPCCECALEGLDGRVDTIMNEHPIDEAQAQSRLKHVKFELHCRARDAQQLKEFEAATKAEIDSLATKERDAA